MAMTQFTNTFSWAVLPKPSW